MRIAVQAFGWRLMVDRVETRRAPRHIRRAEAPAYPPDLAAFLRREEELERLRSYRRSASLRSGRMF